MPDPLELLARDDKWSLGAGDGVLYAPRFPLWLDAPGFWDEATLHQYTFAPLFTVALLDETGAELALRAVSRRWTPAALTLEYRLANGVSAIEVRTVQPGGVFASEWRVRALRSGRFHLVAWTVQPADSASAARWRGAFAFRRTLVDRWDVPLEVDVELGCASGATSWGAAVAECATTQPRWRTTPFRAMWTSEGLPDATRRYTAASSGEADAPTGLYAAVHRALDVNGDRASATFAMRVVPVDERLRVRPVEARLPTVRATSPVDASARAGVHVPAAPPATLDRLSRHRWTDLLERAPRFSCSDPYLESYVRHRWAGLWLMLTGAGGGEYDVPLVCEGSGVQHVPAAAATPALVRELRWLRDPSLARGAMRAFLLRQGPDGSLPAWIALQHVPDVPAVSAPWGDAFAALDAMAPDAALRSALLPRLARWTEWAAPRVAAAIGAPATSDDAPRLAADLIGAYDALAQFGNGSEGAAWAASAAALRYEARDRLWSTLTRTFGRGARPDATGLLLYGAGLASDAQLDALGPALADPARLGTPYPFPSPVGADGARVDPAVAVRAADAVARAAGDDPALRLVAARLIGRVVHTFFADGDLQRPGAFEHYDAHFGHASEHRGFDDVQRAATGDLILSWVAGIRPHAGGVRIDPLPAGLERVEVTGVRVRGRELCVFVDGDRVLATWDGQPHEAALGEGIELAD